MNPLVKHVVDAAAEVFGLEDKDLLGPRRHADLALARHIAMFVARETTPLSWVELGMDFQRDHSVVIYAHRRIQRMREAGAVIVYRALPRARTPARQIDYAVERVWALALRRQTQEVLEHRGVTWSAAP